MVTRRVRTKRGRLPRLACASVLAALTALGVHPALARVAADDAKPIAEKALAWALSGGVAGTKVFQVGETIEVADLGYPPLKAVDVAGRKIVMASLIALQAHADIEGSHPILLIDSLTGQGNLASISVTLRWLSSHRAPMTPPPLEGAKVELEKRDGTWQVVRVLQRWP